MEFSDGQCMAKMSAKIKSELNILVNFRENRLGFTETFTEFCLHCGKFQINELPEVGQFSSKPEKINV